jgi:hypothetical protein
VFELPEKISFIVRYFALHRTISDKAGAFVFFFKVMPETKGKSFEVIAREFRTAAGGGRALSFSTEF